MPEGDLWAGNLGMESMSSGSCDSVVSSTSNHSTFSDECYGHLSAEERECLIFLEETIDSLDMEVDSGVSTDESERVDEASKEPPALHTKAALPKSPYDTFPKSPSQQPAETKSDACRPDLLNCIPVAIPNSGFRSLPRNVQAPREGTTLSVSRNIAASCIDVSTACKEKQRCAPLEQPLEESQKKGSLQNLLIPPPEPFRDQKQSIKQPPLKTELTEVSSKDPEVNEVDGRMIKGQSKKFGKTDASVPFQKTSPSSEGASWQIEQDLPSPQPSQTVVYIEKSSGMQKAGQDTPVAYQDKFGSQESVNFSTAKSSDPHFKQGPPIAPKPRKLPPNIILKRSDGTVVTSTAEPSPKGKTSSLIKNTDVFNVKSFDPREQGKARQEALMKLGLKEKPDILSTSPLKSPGFTKSGELVCSKMIMESTTKDTAPKNVQNGTSQNAGSREQICMLSTSPEKSLIMPKSREVDIPMASTEVSADKETSKPMTQVKTPALSTSPLQSSGFSKPREASVLKEGMTGNGKAEVVDKQNSSPFEAGAGLRLPEGSLPGLRHFSFKSNTLERSGIGLSGYVDSNDQSQKSSGSAFKNAISNKFSSSFLRNTRPRPASLGTGKDFSDLHNPGQERAELEKNENRRSFPLQNFSRSSRPGVSVKITPKGPSNEEHRREALIKLGLLK